MAKTDEFAKYRRTKHAGIATLQASFDTQSTSSSEASLKALQSAHTAQGHQLTQALSRAQDLTGQLAEQEARYSNEISGLKRLVSMMEEREQQTKEIVDNVEHEWATVGEKAERREATLREQVEKEKKEHLETEKRLEQLEAVLDKMGRGELPVPARSSPSTPFRGNTSIDSIESMIGLSPTVAMASRVQRSGKTFTDVYADYIRLQEEYAKNMTIWTEHFRPFLHKLRSGLVCCIVVTELCLKNFSRPRFSPNNESSMNVCRSKPHNWGLSSRRHSRSAILKSILRRKQLKSWPDPRMRPICCRSNCMTLAVKSSRTRTWKAFQ